MNKATLGLGKLVLSSNDPEAVSAFYARAAGVTFDKAEGARRYEATFPDGTALVIEAAADPLPRGKRECALSLRVLDLEAAAARLREGGLEVGPLGDRDGGKLAALKDPDGRDVELWAPRPVTLDAAAESPERPALIEPPPAVIEPPALVIEPPPEIEVKPAEAPPPPEAIEAKPPAIEPPALVIEPPPEIEVKPAEAPPPPEAVEAKPPVIEPPPLVTKPVAENTSDDVKTDAPLPPPMMGAPAPIISAVRPAVASTHGGTKIALYGANFEKGCRVLVSAREIKNPWFVNDTLLKIEAPAREAGPADILIENPDGKRASIAIAYDEGPTIERFSPLEGSPHGGTEITVEGKNFQEGCGITFFSRHAPEVTFISPNVLKFTTPPHEESFHGEVCVTNPDALTTVAEDLFTYRLATPEVHSVSPATGLSDGGKRVLVKGVDFHSKCVARLGGVTASVTWKSSDTLELITPRVEAPGPAALEIENPDGQVGKLDDAFTYVPAPTPPVLVEVRPDRGYCGGEQVIRLYGNNFEGDTIVRIGEVRAVSRFISRREIAVEVPPRKQPGSVAVELTDRHGVVVRREDGFLYESRPAPRVDGVTPRNGPMVGGTKLIIEGDYFDEHVYVRIGGLTPKYAVVRGRTSIETVAPPSREAGLVDVEVGRAEAGLFVAKKAFRYDPSPPPVLESIAPNKGSVDGGTDISIEGKNFVTDSIVLFGRTRAEHVKFVSASTLEVKSPPGKNGEMVDITVKNPDGKEAVSKRAFMYDARYR